MREFEVEVNGSNMPILSAPIEATAMGSFVDDDDMCEWVVGVDWIKTLPRDQPIWEKGMFADQNTATKMRNSFTIERLTERFELEE